MWLFRKRTFQFKGLFSHIYIYTHCVGDSVNMWEVSLSTLSVVKLLQDTVNVQHWLSPCIIFAAGNVVVHITVGSLWAGTAHSVFLERVCNTASVIQQFFCHIFHSEQSIELVADLLAGISMLLCKLNWLFFDLSIYVTQDLWQTVVICSHGLWHD